MRLSVLAVSLILFFSQITAAQHSSGGGGGTSGSGSSSGGSSGGSSGDGSHGGGGGGSSGGYSAGHVSSGALGSHVSGSSGFVHIGTPSHPSSGFVHAPGKIDPLHENLTAGAGEAFNSSVHGDSSEVHNHLLDQALAKIQFAVPADLKNGQIVPMKPLKHIELGPERKPEGKPEVKKEEPDRKHCHGHHCKPHHLTEFSGSNWRMSEDLYTTIQDDCGRLAAKLAQEENEASTLKGRQDSVCAINLAGSECAAATEALNKLNAKITQLHNRYDQCVLHDLRRKAAVYVSQK